jgi:hypothetical protein
VFGLVVLLTVIAAERSVAPPTTKTRHAALSPRRIADYLPQRLTTAVIAATTALVAIGVAATLVASADDLGRAGRWLTISCTAATTQSKGPWPGAFYTVPLLVVIATGLATATSTAW